MKKKMLFVIPICTAALIGVFAVSIYAAAVNNKLDLDLTANSDSKAANISDQAAAVTNISDQAAAKGIYDEKIQWIAKVYKNEGKIISDEQVQKLNELYVSQKKNPAFERLLYQEGIIIGDVDPNAPKLDLATAKDIIAKCNNFEEILSEFDKVQKYPDSLGGSGVSFLVYQLSEYEEISIIIEQRDIAYAVFNPDGTVKSTEMLFE